jgi:hypothetical protein
MYAGNELPGIEVNSIKSGTGLGKFGVKTNTKYVLKKHSIWHLVALDRRRVGVAADGAEHEALHGLVDVDA